MEIIIPDFTPENADDPKVVKLLSEIRRVGGGILPDAKPVYVPVSPEVSTEVSECFHNVSAKVEKDGGNRILGWALREGPVVMNAEFHSIWESPNGKWLDITPKGMPGVAVDMTTRILFVPAPDAKYEEKQVNSISLNADDNPLAGDFIACQQAIFGIINRGERAYQHGNMVLETEEGDVYYALHLAAHMLGQMVQNGIVKRSPCPCRSGKIYENCHDEIVRNTLEAARKFQ